MTVPNASRSAAPRCALVWLLLVGSSLAPVAATAAATAAAREIAGRIVAVADGDTVTLLDEDNRQHKIRLDGIDAPEKSQAFGDRSKQSLSDLVHGRNVRAQCPKTDPYGREVCKILSEGVDVNLEQIRRGMAWHFKRYEREQPPLDRRAYSAAETEAQAARRGLWRDAQPMPPWDCRQRKREGHGCR
jgi:endonuclease YncB( thermonuclease family)